ncbi:MAG: hypothetical protein IT364_25175 [Candidatus Hydrogenedentes bacterium]|nr:hypothetical protein [Candidatus Hydrogenedentota bacterium]
MKDLERELKSISTATPHDSHNRRMERLFLEASHRRSWLSKPIPLWQGLAACAVAVTLGYLYRGSQTPVPVVPTETTRTVYIVPASPEFQRAMQGSAQSRPLAGRSGSYVIELSPLPFDSPSESGDAI